MSIAIVGIGGHGYNLGLMLAHLGLGHLILIDHDIVELSNLNRLLGITSSELGRRKVIVLKKKIKQVNSDIRVTAFPYKAEHNNAIDLLKHASLIVGATDSEASRIFLNRISIQYLIPFVDMGCGITASDDGKIKSAGGQIRFVVPGVTPCLVCIGGIDVQRARQETLSENELQGEIERGYVQGFHLPQPSIVSLNMTTCSIACTEILFFATGLQITDFYLYYDFLSQQIKKIQANKNENCVVCSSSAYLGRGDSIPINPLLSDTPNNYPSTRVKSNEYSL